MLGDQWSCVFPYFALSLAVFYLLLLLVIFRYQWRLFVNKVTRVAQKLFLAFTGLQCIGRIVYFTYWAFFTDVGGDCTTPMSNDTADWLNWCGNIPPPLFLSAFSVNVYTFARIYHTVLARQRYRFRALYSSLILSNLIVYIVVFLNLVKVQEGDVWLWVLLTHALLVALGFFTYALLIYNEIKVRAEANGAPTPRMAKSMTIGWLMRRENNPMFKILVVATMCLACFLVRVAVLVALETVWSDKYPPYALFCYLLFAEVLPLCLMLLIFETSPDSTQTQTSQHDDLQNPLIHAGGEDPKGSEISRGNSGDFRQFMDSPLADAPDSPYTAASFSRPSWQIQRNPPRFSLPETQPFTREGADSVSSLASDSPSSRPERTRAISYRPRSLSQNALPSHGEQSTEE